MRRASLMGKKTTKNSRPFSHFDLKILKLSCRSCLSGLRSLMPPRALSSDSWTTKLTHRWNPWWLHCYWASLDVGHVLVKKTRQNTSVQNQLVIFTLTNDFSYEILDKTLNSLVNFFINDGFIFSNYQFIFLVSHQIRLLDILTDFFT